MSLSFAQQGIEVDKTGKHDLMLFCFEILVIPLPLSLPPLEERTSELTFFLKEAWDVGLVTPPRGHKGGPGQAEPAEEPGAGTT